MFLFFDSSSACVTRRKAILENTIRQSTPAATINRL
jgi:hypothetical protein